ncbi:hypothetical protein RD792_004859 [Penstemon davidsonii]|uniref:TOG domain-containing protein n=1 Tax=Penstemon davidsonii TaxID=160366 RepID=A0ABR0DIJ2_9LAMI|nr:hypothetical protein RD792_004859 [Penstemon davidsonii]
MSVTKQAQARDLKHRVLTCLHKLSDRDTHTAAASELESIAKTLSTDSLPPFLSSISVTDSSDKSPVRRHCLRLISVLSEHHGNSLSPHLSKLLSAITRRLRDPDSSVRSACIAAASSLASHLSSPPFSSISKPFFDSLFTEQDANAQNGAALCLAAMIEGSRNPDVTSLKRAIPRLEKLAKCQGFKAKAAVLSLMGSVVGVKSVLGTGRNVGVKNLVVCLVEFLSSEDWATRKAAAEALIKIATVVDKVALSEYKASCLKTFEAKRFDKVKAARETMNKMIDSWKEIPDLVDEDLPPSESQASSKENASDGRYPPGSKTSIGSNAPQIKKRSSPLIVNENKKGTAMFRKLDHKRASGQKVEIVATPNGLENDPLDGNGVQLVKPEIKRALFNENPKLGVFNNGSSSSVVVSNETGDAFRNQRECDELSLIRKQLVQIENQQSSLLHLLQGFIGNSQNGMHSLEARVQGLEMALDGISFDLAASTKDDAASGAMCCKLPGTNFLSSKLFRKTDGRPLISRLPAYYGTPSVAGVRSIPNAEGFPLENRRYRFQGGRGLIMNPLAEIPRGSNGLSEASSSIKNVAI